MDYREIRNLEDVILFELQKLLQAGGDRRLSFSHIWKVSAAAALNIPHCPPPELKKKFAYEVLSSIENLAGKNLVAIHTRSSYPNQRVTHITATMHGVEFLKSIVFTHQTVTRTDLTT